MGRHDGNRRTPQLTRDKHGVLRDQKQRAYTEDGKRLDNENALEIERVHRRRTRKLIDQLDETGRVDWNDITVYVLRLALRRCMSKRPDVRAAGERLLLMAYNRLPSPKTGRPAGQPRKGDPKPKPPPPPADADPEEFSIEKRRRKGRRSAPRPPPSDFEDELDDLDDDPENADLDDLDVVL